MAIPSELRLGMEVVGWLTALYVFLYHGVFRFAMKKIGEKLDRDLKREALTDPFAAFRQIIELEATINRNNMEHERQRLNDEGSLKFLINEFNKRFSFTNVESFRKHVEEKSSANR